MIEIKDKSLCSGCAACFNICPQECIIMKNDEEGFLYPEVDKSLCIACGLCDKVCGGYSSQNTDVSAYACINKDDKIRKSSSSGGVFYLLAEYVLDCNGVVFGAVFDNDFSVYHVSVENKNDLHKLQGSKYVQSRIGDAYKKAKELIESKRLVLFSGTPCQTDGLAKYLGKEYDNLILQDIICHGVPSPAVWHKYKKYRESAAGAAIQRISFRHKQYGWKTYSVLFKFLNNTEYIMKLNEDLYMKAFLKNLSLRPSCYNCQHKELNRMSDITLADFWGVEKINLDFFDDKGTSLVWIHSKKGKEIFDIIKKKMIFKKTDINEALKYNKAALESVHLPSTRESFFKNIGKANFKHLVNKYSGEKLIDKVKIKIEILWRKIGC